MRTTIHQSLITIHSMLASASMLLAQGSLTPPSAPAPTMKSLDQVASTGIAINSTNTPGNGSNQFVINASGSYYLTGNLTGVSGKNGVLINAINVSLDLNGFEMVGVSGSLAAISDGGNNNGNVRVHNGTIRAWGGRGIALSHSFDSIISDLIVADGGNIGIDCGDGFVLRDCMARNNNGHNIHTGLNANLIHCTAAASVTGDGINLGGASTLTNCVANFNAGSGIFTGQSTITKCNASSNQLGGMTVGDGSVLESCTVANNTIVGGIFAGFGCAVIGCSALQNQGNFGIQVGDGSALIHTAVRGSTMANGTVSGGIWASNACTITDCTVSGTTFTGTASNTTGMGFLIGTDCRMRDCAAIGNSGDGISAGDRSVITGCNSNSNGTNQFGAGIRGGSLVVTSCSVALNGSDGIYVTNYAVVTGNHAKFNGHNGTAAQGINVNGTENRIDGNSVEENSGVGLVVAAAGNFVVRNIAKGNTGANYNIAIGNRVAEIVAPSGNGSFIADTGSGSGGVGFTVNDPWANFDY